MMMRSAISGSIRMGRPPFCSRVTPGQSRRMLSTPANNPSTSTSTYANQTKLPRLPIPDLEKSMEAYVKSLMPLLEQKYTGGNLQKEIEKRKLFARDFIAPGGLGQALHERLKDLDHVSPNNWLDDTLWLKLAYHTWRAPLLVNSNWWLSFKADPSDPIPPTYGSSQEGLPESNPSKDLPAGSQGGGQEWLDANAGGGKGNEMVSYDEATTREWITGYQIKKAAWVIRRFAEYRLMLQRGEVAPEGTKSGPLCMAQYQKLFNFSRIPLPGSDAFSAIAPNALHTTLIVDDFYYSVDIFGATSGDAHPEPLPLVEIEGNIRAAVEDAKRRKDGGEKPAMVGILTGDERDSWTTNRENLLHLSPQNRENLISISTSLIALSLDPYTIPTVTDGDPLRSAAADAQTRNASCGLDGGRNRWLDKAISVMIETNGRTSLLGEHSPVDAIVPSNIVNYAVAEPLDEAQFDAIDKKLPQEGQGWKRLDWVIDEAMTTEIGECQKRNKAIIADSDNSNLLWGEFATEWIKQNAKVSPDSFIQQALQLAWYKDQGYVTATYESASTRGFLHGRTETIRSVTAESRAFVKAMLDYSVEDSKRYDLLLKACSVHNDLSKACSSGMGIDRYLMGLKVQLRNNESHPLFEDEFYSKSQEWKLSTSAFSPGQNFLGIGFGAAWVDGYGINYQPGKHLIKFGIESKVSSEATSTRRFKHHLVQALRDMRRVCEAK